jgi:hypothetical protein
MKYRFLIFAARVCERAAFRLRLAAARSVNRNLKFNFRDL